jgi:predicted phosphodiesterase
VPSLLGWLAILMLLAGTTARGADLPGPWVEVASDGGLDVRSVIAPGMSCAKVVADGTVLTSEMRGKVDGDYPVQTCIAHAAATSRQITVDGLAAPVLSSDIKRIVVLGDTGCRLEGSFTQDCNDPVKWPFATVARLAATHRPDLVIHVGDYYYRETACPASKPGCAGSPFGDNWPVWQKDFFNPAAPLLAAAPWVMVRGNHEICSRGGHGWFRLLDPHPSTDRCTDTTQPYALRIGSLSLVLFDGSDADDRNADPAKVAAYRDQLKSVLADVPAHSWLLTHRPIWALVQGYDAKPGSTLNATEQAAIRDLVPAGLDMVLSGHVHDFTSYQFDASRPAQLIVGEGGDVHDDISQPVNPGIAIDGVKVRRAFATPDYGYVVLHRVSQGWTGTVYSLTDEVLARCRLHGRQLACRSISR